MEPLAGFAPEVFSREGLEKSDTIREKPHWK
jgi:hypothetical protein